MYGLFYATVLRLTEFTYTTKGLQSVFDFDTWRRYFANGNNKKAAMQNLNHSVFCLLVLFGMVSLIMGACFIDRLKNGKYTPPPKIRPPRFVANFTPCFLLILFVKLVDM